MVDGFWLMVFGREAKNYQQKTTHQNGS